MPDFTQKKAKSRSGSPKGSDRTRHSYARRLFFKKLPIRLGMLLVPEIVFSIVHTLCTSALSFRGQLILHPVTLLAFWVMTYFLARKNRRNTHELRHYYLCNGIAFALFFLLALVTYIFNRTSLLFAEQSVYFSYFRMSYLPGMLGDGVIHVEERLLSVMVFFGVTLGIILLEPLVARWRRKRRRK